MQYEFRGKTLAEAVNRAVGNTNQQPQHDEPDEHPKQKICERIQEEMKEYQRKTIEAMDDLNSIGDDLQERIKLLGNSDRWAKLGIVVQATAVATGVGSIIVAMRRLKTTVSAMAGLWAMYEAGTELKDLVSNLNSLLIDIDAIKEAQDIGEPLERFRAAKTTLHYAFHRTQELKFAYENHHCQQVFGRDF